MIHHHFPDNLTFNSTARQFYGSGDSLVGQFNRTFVAQTLLNFFLFLLLLFIYLCIIKNSQTELLYNKNSYYQFTGASFV